MAQRPGVLYYLFELGLRVVRLFYFREVRVYGTEAGLRALQQGPALLAINHTNGLHDFIVPCVCLPRPCSFVAMRPMFRRMCGLCGFIMRKLLFISIDRPMDGGGKRAVATNHAAFDAVQRTLLGQGSVGLYPEGISHCCPELQPLKSGIARMALGAVVRRPGLPVVVVPVGLSYTSPHEWRGGVVMMVGDPVPISAQQADKFAADNPSAVEEVMASVSAGLRSVTCNAPDWTTRRLIDTCASLCLPPAVHGDVPLLQHKVLACWLAGGVGQQRSSMPAAADRLLDDVGEYRRALKAAGVDDAAVREVSELSSARALARAVLCFPAALFLVPLGAALASMCVPVVAVAGCLASFMTRTAFKDQVGSLKAVLTVLLAPAVYLTYDAVGSWALCTVLPPQRIPDVCPWRWFAVLFCALPAVTYAGVRLSEAGLGLLQKGRRAVVRLSAGKAVWDLVQHRAAVRGLVLATLRHSAAVGDADVFALDPAVVLPAAADAASVLGKCAGASAKTDAAELAACDAAGDEVVI
eukprot:TRINITY_DN30663_c0_g1_i1.p1 TRINITY_DN30663_c0_g1~~TRINITY_DN30663_c0_g1_i1.p1  ORF type:complete len:540 (+),score=181.24 TRINITY_DN30663_c0_g1_i1:46-1620(+)